MLRLFNLKVENGWSDKSFMTLLEALKDMLLKDNKILDHTYEVKKTL